MSTKSQPATSIIPFAPAARPKFAHSNKTRKHFGKGLGAILSARADNVKPQISYNDNLNGLYEALKANYDARPPCLSESHL